MARQNINIGTAANDGTGDSLRVSFSKTNDNFTELYASVATITSNTATDISDLTDTQELLFSGNYDDLSNTPFIATDISDLTDTQELLFSGNYDDLSNTPFIATDISDLTDTQELLFSKDYNDLSNTPFIATDISELADSSNVLTIKNNIALVGTYEGSNTIISFEKPENTDSNTVFDDISTFLKITRDTGGIGGAGGGIYNSVFETEWDPAVSPVFTLWNAEGWLDLSDVETRYYQPFRQVLENNIGQNVVDAELIMRDISTNDYYKVKFSSWSQGAAHAGGFAYTREKIDISNSVGITFYDGSKMPAAPYTRVRFEQAYIGDYGDHVIDVAEAGRQIYAYNNILEIPSNARWDFELGDTIQIITAQTASTIRPKVYNDPEFPDPTLYIQSESTAATSFLIPARSMAFLTKIRENTWQLSIGNTLNAFDQDLNTTDSPEFVNLTSNVTGSVFGSANTVLVDANTRSFFYNPSESSDWSNTAPTTIGEAIDRMAAVIKTLNGGTGA